MAMLSTSFQGRKTVRTRANPLYVPAAGLPALIPDT